MTEESTGPGGFHQHLAGVGGANIGKIAVYAWRGPGFIFNPAIDSAGTGWILAEDWWPYQRPTFVTPPFAGYVSGHSTYSRAAAAVMSMLTGDEFFPGGLGEFFAPQNEFLVFEEGPSVDVTLQWAKYYDAADECSLSRIYGGIHPTADDIPGRFMGAKIGPDAYEQASRYFKGQITGGGDGCTADDTTMCLNGGRFRVEISWRDFKGQVGSGYPTISSDDSGVFWFFSPDNWEMMVKVLDGCSINGNYWAFAAATTNVEYTLTVTDTEYGTVRQYMNPLGTSAAAITDTSAFATACP